MYKLLYLLSFLSFDINSTSCNRQGKVIECFYIQNSIMKGIICGVNGCDVVEMR